jgi:hypothetical protein
MGGLATRTANQRARRSWQMKRTRLIGLALMAVFAMSAVAVSSASAAKNGPHWWVCEKHAGGLFTESLCKTSGAGTFESKELLGGETRNLKFKSGITKLKTAAALIECKTDKGTGNIKGGWPGTNEGTIEFEGCTAKSGTEECKVRSKGGTIEGKIIVAVHSELVYTGTKAQAEEEKVPLGILFKTTSATNKIFVELEFIGTPGVKCAELNGPVLATGEEHGPGIAGVAGVVCNIVEKAEEYMLTHEIECPEVAKKTFFYWEGGVIKQGKAGLEFKSLVATQIGNATILEMENAAKEKIAFDARAK